MKRIALLFLFLVVAGCRSSAMTEDIDATKEARDLLVPIQTPEAWKGASPAILANATRLRSADRAVALEAAKNGGKLPGTDQQRKDLEEAVQALRAERARISVLQPVAPAFVGPEPKAVIPDPPVCEHDCPSAAVREQTAATTACHVILEWIKTPADAKSSLGKVSACADRVKEAQSAAAKDLYSERTSADDKRALKRARADVEADLWRLASLPGGGGDDVNAVGHELLMVGFAPRQGPAPGANDP